MIHAIILKKTNRLSPGSGFLYVADMSTAVTKGDVKLQLATNHTIIWVQWRI